MVAALAGLIFPEDGVHYDEFIAASDDGNYRERRVTVWGGPVQLEGILSLPVGAHALVVIAYDRMGQPFHLGPWLGRTLLRPIVDVAFLRARWEFKLNMEQISPEETLAASSIPVLLIHGQDDSNIPVRHSRRIKSRNASVVLWEVPNADHCGAVSAAPREFEQRLLIWFSTHSRQLN